MPNLEHSDPKEHPEQAAALPRPSQAEAYPDEGTADERLDSGQHSDAPGPFGTS